MQTMPWLDPPPQRVRGRWNRTIQAEICACGKKICGQSTCARRKKKSAIRAKLRTAHLKTRTPAEHCGDSPGAPTAEAPFSGLSSVPGPVLLLPGPGPWPSLSLAFRPPLDLSSTGALRAPPPLRPQGFTPPRRTAGSSPYSPRGSLEKGPRRASRQVEW